LFIHIGYLIKLDGINYQDSMESITLFLAISCVDTALTKDESPMPTDISSVEEKM